METQPTIKSTLNNTRTNETKSKNSNNSNNANTVTADSLTEKTLATDNDTTDQSILPKTDDKQQKPAQILDIAGILEKIKDLAIPDEDKASILQTFKYNISHPSMQEDQDLDRIQQKYSSKPLHTFLPQQAQPFNMQYQQGMPHGIMPQGMMQGMQQYNKYDYQPMMQMPQQSMMQPGDYMTTAHFEILKNKMDSLQMELIDLLRHVKDYTQRYMNSARQADLEKIDLYINGLFQVDKALKETQEKAAGAGAPEETGEAGLKGELLKMAEGREPGGPGAIEGEEGGEEPETQGSIISKATGGITNFFSGLGNNLSGVTNLIKSTAGVANSLLSKKIIGGDEEPAPAPAPKPAPKPVSKNVVPVDEYVSNMNELNKAAVIPKLAPEPSVVSSNLNKINMPETAVPPVKKPNSQVTSSSLSNNTADLSRAIDKLNDEINRDIDRTVISTEPDIKPIPQIPKTVQSSSMNNTTTPQQPKPNPNSNIVTSVQMGGGRKYTRLNDKIRILKLKITKQNLEKQLNQHVQPSHQNHHHTMKKLHVTSKPIAKPIANAKPNAGPKDKDKKTKTKYISKK
jgi:hypothetical protein